MSVWVHLLPRLLPLLLWGGLYLGLRHTLTGGNISSVGWEVGCIFPWVLGGPLCVQYLSYQHTDSAAPAPAANDDDGGDGDDGG